MIRSCCLHCPRSIARPGDADVRPSRGFTDKHEKKGINNIQDDWNSDVDRRVVSRLVKPSFNKRT